MSRHPLSHCIPGPSMGHTEPALQGCGGSRDELILPSSGRSGRKPGPRALLGAWSGPARADLVSMWWLLLWHSAALLLLRSLPFPTCSRRGQACTMAPGRCSRTARGVLSQRVLQSPFSREDSPRRGPERGQHPTPHLGPSLLLAPLSHRLFHKDLESDVLWSPILLSFTDGETEAQKEERSSHGVRYGHRQLGLHRCLDSQHVLVPVPLWNSLGRSWNVSRPPGLSVLPVGPRPQAHVEWRCSQHRGGCAPCGKGSDLAVGWGGHQASFPVLSAPDPPKLPPLSELTWGGGGQHSLHPSET